MLTRLHDPFSHHRPAERPLGLVTMANLTAVTQRAVDVLVDHVPVEDRPTEPITIEWVNPPAREPQAVVRKAPSRPRKAKAATITPARAGEPADDALSAALAALDAAQGNR